MLQIIEEQARLQNFTRVRQVRLEVGALAGVEIDALRFGFEVMMRDTLAHDASLEIIELPGRAWCSRCEQPVEISKRIDACPRCQGYHLQITGGDQLRIKNLEVE
jgi:hydrogenase nickel incorporation protein HypA/HybF